jgi:protein TonB
VLGSVIRRVKPDYPVIARNAGVKGAVMVEVQVDEDGRVKKARAVSGPMMLRGSAEAAARNWRFSPARLNGIPVKVTSSITFSFQD